MLKLTEKNYHAAITENFPQLPIETWEPLYEGWANRTFLVNQRMVFASLNIRSQHTTCNLTYGE